MGRPVFCHAKLHDIPTTVRRAARRLGRFGARWVTVHASGGSAMLEAAVEGLQDGAAGRAAGVMAVTVLTTLDDADLAKVGVRVGLSHPAKSALGKLTKDFLTEAGLDDAVRAGLLDEAVAPESLTAAVMLHAERLKKAHPASFTATKQRLRAPVLAAMPAAIERDIVDWKRLGVAKP